MFNTLVSVTIHSGQRLSKLHLVKNESAYGIYNSDVNKTLFNTKILNSIQDNDISVRHSIIRDFCQAAILQTPQREYLDLKDYISDL